MTTTNQTRSKPSPIRVAIVGCGAVSELYYAPALGSLEQSGELQIFAVVDPNHERRECIQKFFHKAKSYSETSQLSHLEPQLTIVASPVRFHSAHVREALQSGSAVLCEKPLAGSVSAAEAMCQVAQETGKLLAVGLFRRFFPALQAARDLIQNESLGAVRSFNFTEGGSFNWPAQSPAFFRRESGCGGVLIDLGIHTLDILLWWFGQPDSYEYADDNMGNVETNSVLKLRYSSGFEGEVRLSRDWSLPNIYEVECERGTIRWQVGEAAQLSLQFHGISDSTQIFSGSIKDGLDYNRCFTAQLKNVVDAIRGKEKLYVPADVALPAQRLIEGCYKRRTLLDMPWLDIAESARAAELTRLTVS